MVTVRVIVDTNLTSASDIVDNLNIEVTPDSENVEVCDTEVENFNIVDSNGIYDNLHEPKGTQPSTIKVSDIVWGTDGEDVGLPDEMEIPSDNEEDEIDYLSKEGLSPVCLSNRFKKLIEIRR